MKNKNHPKLPQWPLKVLRYFINRDYLEEIEGDLEEIFYNNIELLGHHSAKRILNIGIFKLIRACL